MHAHHAADEAGIQGQKAAILQNYWSKTYML